MAIGNPLSRKVVPIQGKRKDYYWSSYQLSESWTDTILKTIIFQDKDKS